MVIINMLNKLCKSFEIKNLGYYHVLCFQSNILLLADVFENFKINVLKYMNLVQLIFY